MDRVCVAWLGALTSWASRAGANRRKLLEAAGLTEAELEEPTALPTVAQELALWAAIDEALHDPLAGLSFGSSIHSARAFGIAGYLGRNGPNWDQALDDIARYYPLIGLRGARVWREGAITTLTFELPAGLMALRQPAEAWAAATVAAWRAATFTRGIPSEVRLTTPAPERAAAYKKFFGCPVVFGDGGLAVSWASRDLLHPIPTHDPMNRLYFERVATRALAKTVPATVTEAVRREVERALKGGTPSLATVGKRLGQGARTLQRRLRADGTSFEAIVDETRCRLALQLVHGGELSLEETAFRLGFAEPSAFRRAFRRWYGHSPRQERRRVRLPD